ncbi:unnamed protein product, partial [Choristocarpus tenellus]
RWSETTFGAHFLVSPTEGMLAPLSEIALDVIFTPQCIDDDIRQEGVLCNIEGNAPLKVTLTGSCMPQPADSVHVLSFSSRARQGETKEVELTNPTDKPWFISPVLKAEHWRGAGEVQVPAKGTATYKVEFMPLSM